MRGLVITGFPRSGTTLALRVLCPGLSPGQMSAGGLVNEPREVSEALATGNPGEVSSSIKSSLNNGFGIVKHPFLSFALSRMEPKFRVLSIFRDLREVVCSVYVHHNRSSVVGDDNSWKAWAPFDFSMSRMERVVAAWKSAHLSVLGYRGELEVWSYGFWKGWRVECDDISSTYPDARESSAGVIEDVARGATFSESGSGRENWQSLVEKKEVGPDEIMLVKRVQDEVMRAYYGKGIEVFTRW